MNTKAVYPMVALLLLSALTPPLRSLKGPHRRPIA